MKFILLKLRLITILCIDDVISISKSISLINFFPGISIDWKSANALANILVFWQASHYSISDKTPLNVQPQNWLRLPIRGCGLWLIRISRHLREQYGCRTGQTDPKLGDERLKARPRATASVRVKCTSYHSRINGPSEAVAWKRYFCFITKTDQSMFIHLWAPFQSIHNKKANFWKLSWGI